MEKSDQEIVEECVSKFHSGEDFRSEFSILVRRHSGLVFSVILSRIGNYHLSEEVAQEAFIRAYRKFSTFNQRKSFMAWICKIAKNCCVDHQRKKTHETLSIDEIYTSQKPVPRELYRNKRQPEVSEMRRKINQAILTLPDMYRKVTIMCFLGKMSYREIARNLNLPETTIKSRLFRSRKILHKSLKPLMGQITGRD